MYAIMPKRNLLLALLSILKTFKCDLILPSKDPFIAQENFIDRTSSKKFGEDGGTLLMKEYGGFLDPKIFITYHAIPSVPIVMRNAAKHFPAYELWKTDDYFLSLDLSDEEFVSVETKKKENRSMDSIDMHFQDFVEIYNEADQYMVKHFQNFCGKITSPVTVADPRGCRRRAPPKGPDSFVLTYKIFET